MNETSNILILDANVLLYDPQCIFSYPGARIFIPIFVIEEIDRFKKEVSETGRNARYLTQVLDRFRLEGSLTEGIKLENKAVLSVYLPRQRTLKLPDYIDLTKSSNKVLVTALEIQESFREPITLVTNNTNLRIRCSAMGVRVSSYEDRMLDPETLYESIRRKDLNEKNWDRFDAEKKIRLNEESFYPNQHILLQQAEDTTKSQLCRYNHDKDALFPVEPLENGVWNINARNLEQMAALDILMDPSIDIVILAGKAGTGKTMLALAAALEQMLMMDHYKKILVSRPIYPMGKDMGYLPGDINEKMAPWMQPIFDNLEFLMNASTGVSSKMRNAQQLMEKKLIELEALTYIRGRSIPNRFMIIDEAQNLTPHEIKTIITRVGDETKLVLTGDPQQIDNPYVDSASNGLSYVVEKLKPHSIAAHVHLLKGERSPLAELAANVL